MTSAEILVKMQESFLQIYNVYSHNTVIYALLSAYASKFENKTDMIDRLYGMIGIDTTRDEDLEHRWGSLLDVYRNIGESYANYRARLLIIYSSLAGGTEESIKYAIASTIGISSDPEMINKYIHVYDAWLYDPIKYNDKYGSLVCTVDIVDEKMTSSYDSIIESINRTKASGVASYLIMTYILDELVKFHADELYYMSNISKSDNESLNIDKASDKLFEIIKHTIQEEVTYNREMTNMFYPVIGYNTNAFLNVDFKTNMLMKSDEHKDIIMYL